MLLLGASPPGPLDEYAENVARLSREFPEAWGLQHRADEVMRAEFCERRRRHIEDRFRRGLYREPFDPAR
eukprot:11180393-Lingulodinium_polyedra.AAC.1